MLSHSNSAFLSRLSSESELVWGCMRSRMDVASFTGEVYAAKDEIWFHSCLNLSPVAPLSPPPQPPPFYDYYVIYSHMKRSSEFRNGYNCMIIILWEQFCFALFLGRRIKFVKSEMKNAPRKEINVNSRNILSCKCEIGEERRNVVISAMKENSLSVGKIKFLHYSEHFPTFFVKRAERIYIHGEFPSRAFRVQTFFSVLVLHFSLFCGRR